jgi:hypothetical protein
MDTRCSIGTLDERWGLQVRNLTVGVANKTPLLSLIVYEVDDTGILAGFCSERRVLRLF